MKHDFQKLVSPIAKVELMRCTQCFLKIRDPEKYLDQECEPNKESKRAATNSKKGIDFINDGRFFDEKKASEMVSKRYFQNMRTAKTIKNNYEKTL